MKRALEKNQKFYSRMTNRRTDGQTVRPTDRQTDRETDTPSYKKKNRGNLKIQYQIIGEWQTSCWEGILFLRSTMAQNSHQSRCSHRTAYLFACSALLACSLTHSLFQSLWERVWCLKTPWFCPRVRSSLSYGKEPTSNNRWKRILLREHVLPLLSISAPSSPDTFP